MVKRYSHGSQQFQNWDNRRDWLTRPPDTPGGEPEKAARHAACPHAADRSSPPQKVTYLLPPAELTLLHSK